MSNSRELSKIFTTDTIVTTHSELITTVAAASAYVMQEAMTYTDNSTPDLTPAIQAASAAAVAYADSLTTTDIEEGSQFYFTNSRAINAGSATYIPQTSEQTIINSASGAAVTFLVNSAPSTLDTLNELATALGNDENFSTTVTNSLASKLNISTASATYLTQISASTLYEPDIPYVSASPSGPSAGTLWIDSTASAAPALKVYNGTEWIIVSGAGGGGLKTHLLLMGA